MAQWPSASMAASLPAKRKNERYYKNPTTISARALAYLAWVIRVVLTARPSLPVYFDNRTSRSWEIGRADFARWPRFDRRKSYRDAIAIARPARFDFFRPGRSDIVVLGWTRIAFFWPCVRCHDPGSLDCTTWTGLTIFGTKQPSTGNLPSRLTILSSKTRCLSWRPYVKRSPTISRTISQAGNRSPT